LKLEYRKLLSTFAYNFNLRRYNLETVAVGRLTSMMSNWKKR
jgi:hypothetical protein